MFFLLLLPYALIPLLTAFLLRQKKLSNILHTYLLSFVFILVYTLLAQKLCYSYYDEQWLTPQRKQVFEFLNNFVAPCLMMGFQAGANYLMVRQYY